MAFRLRDLCSWLLGAMVVLSFAAPMMAAEPSTEVASAEQAQEINKDDKKAQQTQKSSKEKQPIKYIPPLRGAPVVLVGGGTRSGDEVPFVLRLLAPAHVSYTTHAQPTLFWYVSKEIKVPVDVGIIDVSSFVSEIKPLFEMTMKPPIPKGIYSLRLEKHGIRLQPDVDYQWFIAVAQQVGEHSRDMVTGIQFKYVAASDSLKKEIDLGDYSALPAIYARHGIWLDALDQLARLIASASDALNRQTWRRQRAALFEQVGLNEAAAYDRNNGR